MWLWQWHQAYSKLSREDKHMVGALHERGVNWWELVCCEYTRKICRDDTCCICNSWYSVNEISVSIRFTWVFEGLFPCMLDISNCIIQHHIYLLDPTLVLNTVNQTYHFVLLECIYSILCIVSYIFKWNSACLKGTQSWCFWKPWELQLIRI